MFKYVFRFSYIIGNLHHVYGKYVGIQTCPRSLSPRKVVLLSIYMPCGRRWRCRNAATGLFGTYIFNAQLLDCLYVQCAWLCCGLMLIELVALLQAPRSCPLPDKYGTWNRLLLSSLGSKAVCKWIRNLCL
jgi:hypothetical protein